MATSRVKVEIIDGVGLLTLCGTGPGNAMTESMWRELAEAAGRLGDEAVRAVVLNGAGHEAFATDGEDLAAGPPVQAACVAIGRLPMPVIARIRGDCLQAGLVLALAADIRIAAEDSVFALSAERAVELGAERLLATTAASARFLLLTGARIEAREAHSLGLIDRVVPDADLSDVVADTVRQTLDQPVAAVRAVKRALAAGA